MRMSAHYKLAGLTNSLAVLFLPHFVPRQKCLTALADPASGGGGRRGRERARQVGEHPARRGPAGRRTPLRHLPGTAAGPSAT